ncbi:MAG: hypothetical protein LBT47_05935 [Deltaproteobacteria bacterium]|jgi:putative RNA 2'-phosphotransferase|nr:hypothetical protein [Deltaproteobacteria bacterium]
MAKQKLSRQTDNLEKLLVYVLGVAPHEFGLLPDREGYLPLKEVLAAIKSEAGFGGVNEARIVQICRQPGDASPFDLEERRLRIKPGQAWDRDEPQDTPAPPKILYFGLKPSVWPHVAANGLLPKSGEEQLRLFSDAQSALKVAGRFCPDPLTITVRVRQALDDQAQIKFYAGNMWSSPELKPQWLSGPPVLPREEKTAAKPPALPGASSLLLAEVEVTHGDKKNQKKGKYNDAPDWKIRTRRDRRRNSD